MVKNTGVKKLHAYYFIEILLKFICRFFEYTGGTRIHFFAMIVFECFAKLDRLKFKSSFVL